MRKALSNPPVAGMSSGWLKPDGHVFGRLRVARTNINKDYFTLVRGWVFNTAAYDVNANYA
jgi:hypothetical protein